MTYAKRVTRDTVTVTGYSNNSIILQVIQLILRFIMNCKDKGGGKLHMEGKRVS